jgi:hypothetical protein
MERNKNVKDALVAFSEQGMGNQLIICSSRCAA